MTPLRKKMIKAMELRNLSKNTQRYYLSAVIGVARYYQQSPDTLSQEMIEDYLLYLKKGKGNTPGTCNSGHPIFPLSLTHANPRAAYQSATVKFRLSTLRYALAHKLCIFSSSTLPDTVKQAKNLIKMLKIAFYRAQGISARSGKDMGMIRNNRPGIARGLQFKQDARSRLMKVAIRVVFKYRPLFDPATNYVVQRSRSVYVEVGTE
jgi:hypothetical protein